MANSATATGQLCFMYLVVQDFRLNSSQNSEKLPTVQGTIAATTKVITRVWLT